jgi:uncharacterized membrane protein
MSTFAVMVFPEEKKAYEGLHALQELHTEGSVTVWGTGVLGRAADGRVSVLKRTGDGPLGTGLGALAGGFVGLFGGPLGAAVGVAVGATAGGVGDLVRLGVSEDFLQAVQEKLAPGTFALIAELSEEWQVPLDTRMEQLGTAVVREDRIAFEADLLEKRVEARKARFGELRAEHAERKKEKARKHAGEKAEAMMRRLLGEELEYERRKLEYAAERTEQQIDTAKEELDAKIAALREQASGAKKEVRDRIEQRLVAARKEFAEREQKRLRARELTREALHA